MPLASSETENYTPEQQYGGEADVVSASGTVASGNNLARLTVVARQTADNKLVPYDPAGTGGAEVALGITAEAIDASLADAVGPIYIGGVFNPDELVWGGAVTAAQKEVAFDGTNIALRKPRYSGEVV